MSAAHHEIAPVTPQRVRALVSQRGEFVRVAQGGVTGRIDQQTYQVIVEDNDLVVRTRWSRLLPPGSNRSAAQLVNDWNRDRVLPTLFTSAFDDGIAVFAVSSTPVAVGLTDDQLADVVDVALTVTAHALRTLAASVPAS